MDQPKEAEEVNTLRRELESQLETIFVSGYCHADWEWTHSRTWHAERYALTFNEVLDIMDRDEVYKWYFDTLNEELNPFLERYPERVQELKKCVKEGRIGIAGGTITSPQMTNIGGETFIRNMVYGRRYFEKEFPGADLSVLALNDTTVGCSQLPQLIKEGGYKYFCFTRPSEALHAKGVPKQFFWEGLDGTKILCTYGDYGIDFFYSNQLLLCDYKQNWDKTFSTVATSLLRYSRLAGSDILWIHEGADDKRPLRVNIPWIPREYPKERKEIAFDVYLDVLGFVEEWNKREKVSIKFATPAEYFTELEKRGEKIPIWKGILDPLAWVMGHGVKGYCPGGYRIESLLLTAEKICCTAHIVTGLEYPEAKLSKIWHDYLSLIGHANGYSYRQDHEEIKRKKANLKYEINGIITSRIRHIANRVKAAKKGLRVVVFNDLAWDRKDIVRAYFAYPEAGAWGVRVFDSKGKEIPSQVTKWVPFPDGSLSEGEIIFVGDVPSQGYNTYYIIGQEEYKCKEVSEERLTDEIEIESRQYKMKITEGGICLLYSKTLNQELFKRQGILGNDILFYHAEKPIDFRAGFLNGAVDKAKCLNSRMIENGPVRKRIAISGTINGIINVEREIHVYEEVPRIDFYAWIHAPEGDGAFRIQFPFKFEGKIIVGVPFGAEERELGQEPLVGIERDYRGYEHVFYAAPWLDYANVNGSYGIAVLPQAEDQIARGFTFDPRTKILEYNLLTTFTLPKTGWRSELNPEIEGHEPESFAYSLYPHAGDWKEGEVYRRSLETQNPLRAIVLTGENKSADLPEKQSFIKITPSSLVLSSLSMENKEIILRFYEQCGSSCKAELNLPFSVTNIVKTDFNSKEVDTRKEALQVAENKVTLNVKPWEIVTLEAH